MVLHCNSQIKYWNNIIIILVHRFEWLNILVLQSPDSFNYELYSWPGSWPHNSNIQSIHVCTAWTMISFAHSYYFTTCILVLKFTNKGVFFAEIQDSHFHRKRGYFGTHLLEFGTKRGYFWCPVFYREKGGSFGLKSQCFTAKKGFILDWKVRVLSRKRGRFELKSQCFAAKKGVIFKLENKDGYHFFPVSEGAGSWPRNSNMQGINVCTASTIISFALWMAVAQRHVYCGNGKQRGTLTCASSLLPCILCQWSCNVIYTMTNIHAKYMYVLSNVDVCHIIYDMQTTMHSLI